MSGSVKKKVRNSWKKQLLVIKSQGKVTKNRLFLDFSWLKAIFFDFSWLSFLQSVRCHQKHNIVDTFTHHFCTYGHGWTIGTSFPYIRKSERQHSSSLQYIAFLLILVGSTFCSTSSIPTQTFYKVRDSLLCCMLCCCYVTAGTFARRGLSSTAKTLRSLSGVRGSEY